MIQKDKIEMIEDRTSVEGSVLVIAKYRCGRCVPVYKSEVDAPAMEHARRGAAVGLWRDVYGELVERLVEIKRDVVVSIPPWSSGDAIVGKIDGLLGALADPTPEEVEGLRVKVL